MHSDPAHGNVLVLVARPDEEDLLGRAIADTGERPFFLRADVALPALASDAPPIDLVVTDLSCADPVAGSVLERLVAREILPGVPRIHLARKDARARSLPVTSDATTMAVPLDVAEFQVRVRLAAEIGRLRREVERTVARDPLTGVGNRRVLLERIEEEFARASRHRTPLSLVLFDIDELGRVNDTFGESSGDSVLAGFAEILQTQVRKEDVIGRLAGAVLAVVLPGNGARGAATFANKVRNDVEGIVLQDEGQTHPVRVSAGITTYPDNATLESGERLVRAASGALVEAKARGGNRVFIDELVLRHERRVVLVADPDPELLDQAEDLLALDDYHVVRTDSARTALETLRFRRPDLLIVDVQMAEREGGVPLIEQVRTFFPQADFPVIGLSSDPASHLAATRVRVDRFITKPFSLSLLRAAARDLIEDQANSR